MSESFTNALAFTLQWEGGYVNHPADPGGATNLGITQNVYNAWRKSKRLLTQSVQLIARSEAEAIYKTRYWDVVNGDSLTPKLAMVMFDVAVNHGPGRAKEWIKQAKALMDADPDNDDLELSRRIIDLRVNFYYSLARRRPQMKVFLKGWLNRARALKQAVGY